MAETFSASGRITGKSAAIYGVLARTTISSAVTMTDGGAHTIYTYQPSGSAVGYWNPNLAPTITKQTGGTGSFDAVNPSLYTVNYITGTITFLSANGASDVVKINSIEWMTVQKIGQMESWTLDLKQASDNSTAFGDTWETNLQTFKSWKGTASGYKVSAFWFNNITADNPEFYLAFYPVDASGGTGVERYVGAAILDWSPDVKKDKTIMEKITFTGTGVLSKLTS